MGRNLDKQITLLFLDQQNHVLLSSLDVSSRGTKVRGELNVLQHVLQVATNIRHVLTTSWQMCVILHTKSHVVSILEWCVSFRTYR